MTKSQVLKKCKTAFCVKMETGRGYIVCPGPVQGRGFEQPAIGIGNTARQAWASVKMLKGVA